LGAEAGSSVVGQVIDAVERLLAKRRWVLGELRRFEEKYGMSSREFYEAWRRGLLPEPEDPEVHGDFTVWAGLIEELEELEKELVEKIGQSDSWEPPISGSSATA